MKGQQNRIELVTRPEVNQLQLEMLAKNLLELTILFRVNTWLDFFEGFTFGNDAFLVLFEVFYEVLGDDGALPLVKLSGI